MQSFNLYDIKHKHITNLCILYQFTRELNNNIGDFYILLAYNPILVFLKNVASLFFALLSFSFRGLEPVKRPN